MGISTQFFTFKMVDEIDELILYKRFLSSRGFFCQTWAFLELCSKIQFVILCDTESCWLCHECEFYRASLQHYLLYRFPDFFTDTWKDDNFCFQSRDFTTLLSNPFFDFLEIFLEMQKSFSIESPAETCVATSVYFSVLVLNSWNMSAMLKIKYRR